jgi:hypothetical protein
MLIVLVIILVALWLLGYTPISTAFVPNPVVLTINNHPISLWEIFILIVIAWAIGILPRPLQAVASILLILWVLSVLGIFAIAGLSNMLVVIIIVGLIISIFL